MKQNLNPKMIKKFFKLHQNLFQNPQINLKIMKVIY